jgi:uncharacterized protein
MDEKEFPFIITTVLDEFPDTAGIYLFGSSLHGDPERAGDIDIALLFPHIEAKERGSLFFSETVALLSDHFHKPVDLVNIRTVSTVFRFEIIRSGKRLYTGNQFMVDEFEMLTISFYQRLNNERKEIFDQLFKTSRAVHV